MASQGPRYPSAAVNLSNAGTSENTDAWVNPTNVGADDTSEATITAATYDSPDISQILVASGFGFTLAAGSTVDGILVEIMRRNSAGAASDNRVQLATGTTFADLVGTNKADTALDWPTTEAQASYGGAADTWTAGLTAAQVNAAGFAVFLSVQADAANTDIQVDYIRVTVTYTEPAPSGTGAITVPSATVSGTGELILTGTGAIEVPSATVSGTGAEVFTATGAIEVPAATVAGTGEHGEAAPPSGTGDISVPAATVSGVGELILTATGAIAVPAGSVSGAGAEIFTATGAISVSSATVAGDGLLAVAITGTGAIVVSAPTVSGSGTHPLDEIIPPVASAARLRARAMAAAASAAAVAKGRGHIKDFDDWLEWWD